MQGINCESTWPGLMAKFGGRVLCHLLANVIREGGRQSKNLVLRIFSKIHT